MRPVAPPNREHKPPGPAHGRYAAALFNSTAGLLVNLAADGTGTSLNGWGWQNGAYWLSQPTLVTFANAGAHTMRIQVREDGVAFDQLVLSSSRYLSSAPGALTNDTTIPMATARCSTIP
jgi:hypothetical protein